MKKIGSLLIVLFLVTGCEATYNLEIIDNTFKENIEVYVDSSKKNEELEDYGNLTYEELFDMRQNENESVYFGDETYNPYEDEKQDNVSYYKIALINNSNHYGLNYTYDFDINKYPKSKAVNTCYKEFVIQKHDNMYSLATNNIASCLNTYPLLDKLTINLKLDYRVIYQNADKVSDNVYTWVINRDNYQTKSIKVNYTKNQDITSSEENPENPSNPNDPNNPSDPNTPSNPSNPSNPSKPDTNPEPEETPKNSFLDYILVGCAIAVIVIGVLGFIKYKSIR